MESGADDVFLSSDVDLDVRLKVCAAKSTVFLGMRQTQKEHHSLTELFPHFPTSQVTEFHGRLPTVRMQAHTHPFCSSKWLTKY